MRSTFKYLAAPAVEKLDGVQLQLKAVAVLFQLLPFDVTLPALAQHVLHALHVRLQLPLDLRRDAAAAAAT